MPPFAAVAAGAAAFVFAPLEARAQTDAAAGDIEEVVVTGSRIRYDSAEARDLATGVGADDARRTGLTALGDILARLPVSGAALNTRFNSSGNFGFPADGGGVGAGAAHVDLRHLGAKRVLVLVDGLRWIHGSSGSGVSGAADLNTLPASIVERVEVSLEGASAIYGSDAIAGVVNIVTADASGVSGSVSAGGYGNDGAMRNMELSLGGTRGATAASIHINYADQDPVGADRHEQTRYPTPGTGNRHGSSFTPQGRVIFTDPNTGVFVNCALNEGVVGAPRYDPADPCGAGDDYHPWSNADRFNYAPYNLVVTPSTRTGVFARIGHQLSERTRVYARALHNRRESANQAAPEPVWAGSLAESGSLLDQIVIDAANPYNPFGFDIGANAWATRRPLESGPRVFEQDVRTRYLAAGVESVAQLWQRTFYWDANIVWSRNVARQTKHGAHNARKMLLALGPPDACAATSGCLPLNLLGGQADGGGTITSEMLRWFGFTQRDYSDQTLRDFTFNVTGDLLDLPAGPLAVAAGFQQRAQRGRFDPDPVVAAGDTAGLQAEPTSGAMDVTEWYGEVDVPLLAAATAAESLDFAAAVRGFRYDTFGSDTTGRVGLRWRPLPELLVRASWAEGFRAPNIGELFGGATRLDAAIADPCSQFHAADASAALIDNCVAAGVPADGSYKQLGSQVAVRTGGNDRLQPETSRSTTIAAVWRPSVLRLDALDDLRVELTRYEHRIDGAITAFDAQGVLNGCYANGQPAFCALVERNAQGHIRRFDNTLLNVGVVETSGWDFGVTATSAATATGVWRAQWRGTYLAEYTERLKDTAGAVVQTRRLAGQTHADRGKPRWKSTLTVDWERAPWSASLTVRYLHSMTERCTNFQDGSPDSLTNLGLCSLPNAKNNAASRNRLAATTYFDASVRYSLAALGGDLAFTAGANNILNRDPPISRSATLNGYDASTYDIPGGRFAYLRVAFARD